tara:strand:- start:206 stop:535 length:330 start_codon:yes stop_codon:yes gene_type:complete
MKFKQCFGIMTCFMLLVSHPVKASNSYTEEIKSFYGLMYEPLEIDPSTKNKDLKEKADDEKKRERQKHQMNFADSSYNSLIKYNFVFYFIYKHKYENRSQERLEGLSVD